MTTPVDLKVAFATCESLDDYVKALESAVTNFRQKDVHKYICYYLKICEADMALKIKKTLITALVRSGIPFAQSYSSNEAIIHVLKNRDLPLLIFLIKKVKMKFTNEYYVLRECREMGANPKDNQFAINLLNKIGTTITIQKSFLRGAIKTGNRVLIKYIVEVLKPDLYIPTSQVRSIHGLYAAFAESGDLALLKYFEEHGYNIHECQRELLNHCYNGNEKTDAMRQYILSEQERSSAPDTYTEKLANTAFKNDNAELLTQFGNIKMVVKWTQVLDLLKANSQLVFVKAALKRFVDREIEQNVRYDRNWNKSSLNGNYKIITPFHVNQVWKLTKDRKLIWECFKEMLQIASEPDVIELANKKDGTKNTVDTPSSDEELSD
jgi:hypothetical protein